MAIEGGYTPRQFVVDRVLGYLKGQHAIGSFHPFDGMTPADNRAVLKAIAKLHNRLLDKSGLDGTYID